MSIIIIHKCVIRILPTKCFQTLKPRMIWVPLTPCRWAFPNRWRLDLSGRPQCITTAQHAKLHTISELDSQQKQYKKKQLNTMLNYSYHQLSNNLSSSMVKSCQSHGICGIAPIKSSEMGIFKVSPVNSMWQSLDATGEWSARLRANTTKLRGVPWCSCFEKFKLDDPMDFLEL